MLTEEQRQRLGVLPLRLPAAAALPQWALDAEAPVMRQAASPDAEELPLWAQARTPRPADDDPPEEIAAATQGEDDDYDVCHDCGAMHLPADNHHHEQGEDDEDDDEAGEGEG